MRGCRAGGCSEDHPTSKGSFLLVLLACASLSLPGTLERLTTSCFCFNSKGKLRHGAGNGESANLVSPAASEAADGQNHRGDTAGTAELMGAAGEVAEVRWPRASDPHSNMYLQSVQIEPKCFPGRQI